MLKGKEPSRAAPARHDLVTDEKNAVATQEFLEPLQVARGRRQDAVGACDGLDDHRRDVLGTLVGDDLLEVPQVVGSSLLRGVPKAVVIGARIHHPNHTGSSRLVGPAPRVTGQLHAEIGGSVVAAVPTQDLVPTRVEARHLDGILVGLGAAQREIEGVDVAWNQARQLAGETRAHLGGRVWKGIDQAIGRLLHGRHDLGMAVPDIDAHELGVEVQNPPTIGLVEVDPFRTLDGHGSDRIPSGPGEERVLLA